MVLRLLIAPALPGTLMAAQGEPGIDRPPGTIAIVADSKSRNGRVDLRGLPRFGTLNPAGDCRGPS